MDLRTNAQSELVELIKLIEDSIGLDLAATVDVAGSAETPIISVRLSGPDAGFLLRHNGELLEAVHEIAAAILDLDSDPASDSDTRGHLLIEVDPILVQRLHYIWSLADAAVSSVHKTSKPYSFPPMDSPDRSLLQLALSDTNLKSFAVTEGSISRIVLYPDGTTGSAASCTISDAFIPERRAV